MPASHIIKQINNGLIISCLINLLFYTCSYAGGENEFNLKEVSPGNFVHSGQHVYIDDPRNDDIANIGFITGDKCIAVIDTGGSYKIGKLLLAAIRNKSDLPICYVINTHIHYDHVLGNSAFTGEQPKFIGHINLKDEIERNRGFFLENFGKNLGPEPSETTIIGPTVTVEDNLEIDLGGKKLRLSARPVAHSHSDLTIVDLDTGTLWAGDLLFRERIPVLDGNLKNWLKVINDLSDMALSVVVPGHGTVSTEWPGAIMAEKTYLTVLLEQTRDSITKGLFLDEAVSLVGLKEKEKWLLHDQDHGRNVTRAFSELEWE